MRDLIVSLFIIGALPVCFRRPLAGMLLFSLLAYMRLQDLTWGFARFERWSLYVALAMYGGWLVSSDKGKLPIDLRVGLLIFLPVQVILSKLFAKGSAPLARMSVLRRDRRRAMTIPTPSTSQSHGSTMKSVSP